MIFEKIRERLELYRFDIQKVVSKVLEKYGFPYESVVQDEIHYELDNFFENKDTINIINQVEAEYNNGWIPCSERLPNFDEDVLLYMSGYEMQMGYKDIQAFGEVVFYVYNSQVFVDLEDVIAWMPLPDPYIPKADETEHEWKSQMMNHFTKGE